MFFLHLLKDRVSVNQEYHLIEKLQKGDVESFNRLFELYSSRLYHFGLKYLKSEVESEGLVQEVFLTVWRKRSNLKKEKDFKAYLYTIAFNRIKKHFSKKAILFEVTDHLVATLKDTSTEDEIQYRAVLDQVKKYLQELPEKKRQIFELSRFEGLSSKEIAAKMNLAPKTIDNQISEVIRFLKDKLHKGDVGALLFLVLYS